jgi:hypothetical protein
LVLNKALAVCLPAVLFTACRGPKARDADLLSKAEATAEGENEELDAVEQKGEGQHNEGQKDTGRKDEGQDADDLEAARAAERVRSEAEARLAREARAAEEARLAEEARIAKEARQAELLRQAEAAVLAEEQERIAKYLAERRERQAAMERLSGLDLTTVLGSETHGVVFGTIDTTYGGSPHNEGDVMSELWLDCLRVEPRSGSEELLQDGRLMRHQGIGPHQDSFVHVMPVGQYRYGAERLQPVLVDHSLQPRYVFEVKPGAITYVGQFQFEWLLMAGAFGGGSQRFDLEVADHGPDLEWFSERYGLDLRLQGTAGSVKTIVVNRPAYLKSR